MQQHILNSLFAIEPFILGMADQVRVWYSVVTTFSNLFPSGHYLISLLQLMSAASCTGRYRHTNIFTIIYFNDGKVSEGFYMRVFIA